MKKFLFALLCVMLTAGFAFAVDVDLKGMYYVRGTWIDNETGLLGDNNTDSPTYFYFDHELDATARLLVTDKTRVIINFEIRDENWLVGNTDGTSQDGSSNLDDNIEFKRVFFSHTFDAYGTVLDGGLMTGGAWHTGFGDNGNGRYRIKITQPTELGPVIGVYEKRVEVGERNGTVKKAEKDDEDAYYLAMVTKLGPVNVYPLVGYIRDSSVILDQGSDGVNTFLVLLGASGAFGDFGWEAEFNYLTSDFGDFDPPANDDDFDRWGIYGNAWMNIGAGKVGLLGAYGSWSDDRGAGFGFGEDFTPTVFGADWTTIGNSSLSEYNAVTMFQLYGSLALSEELSLNAAGLYWWSNADENADGTDNFWKDSDGYEIGLGLDWKLTDMVTYTIASGFGKISLDDNAAVLASTGDKPDSFVRAYHRFKISF